MILKSTTTSYDLNYSLNQVHYIKNPNKQSDETDEASIFIQAGTKRCCDPRIAMILASETLAKIKVI